MSQFGNLMKLFMDTQPEAEAAGLSTLMKKLGVTLKEAKAIKAAAKAKKAASLQDDNMRAIKNVRDYKGGSLAELGEGADAKVFDAGDKVVKVPKGASDIKSEAIDAGAPVMLGDLGVPTKNIKTSQKMYQVQDKVNTPKVRAGADDLFRKLSDEQETISDAATDFARKNGVSVQEMDDLKNVMTPEQLAKYDSLEEMMNNRTQDMWKSQGIDPKGLEDQLHKFPEEDFRNAMRDYNLHGDNATTFPMDTLAAITNNKARKTAKGFTPQDVHAGNIGLDDAGNPKIFDTSRFMVKNPNEIKPEQFKQIKDSIVASPKNKGKVLDELAPSDQFPKAAAVAPLGAAMGAGEEEGGLFDKGKEAVLSGLSSALDSPTTQGAIDLMSIPGALGRSTVNAITENRAPTLAELQEAATFPTSEKNEQLATKSTEAVFPNEEDVLKRTALETLLKTM